MATNTITLGSIHEFSLELSYHNPHAFPPEKEPLSHIHTRCEIYFNLSGDVSFMVEGHTYPISSGNVIISRPLEYHHCIYHNTLEHEHFCLLFSCAEKYSQYSSIFSPSRPLSGPFFVSVRHRPFPGGGGG